MNASRALRFLAVVLGGTFAGSALAGPSLVVDVDTGRVIHSEGATDPWYPASVTKLMTAYVALDLVRQGRVAMDTLLTVSPEAAAQPPSKMGFRPGTQVTLDNALKIIMVKSANDVAQTVAENLGGSVEGFAALMNGASARLGMAESRWVNPHGLPDERQWTSARDMALLGRALLREFPEHRALFAIGAIKFGRRVMANHNGLMGRYEGADGMKTGFICSSGFNVVASATRGGRRLIAVVMGSPNATERTFRAAELFDKGFESSGPFGWGGQSLQMLAPSAAAGPPDMRPYTCERRGPAPAEDEAQAPVANAEAGTGGNSDNPLVSLFSPTPTPSALAFAGGSVPTPRRQLGPRAPLEPVLVWTGATPTVAPSVGEPGEKLLAKPRTAKAVASIKPQARPLTRPQPATDSFIANAPPSIMDDGKPKAAANPAQTLATRPKPRAVGASEADAKPKAAATATKPAPKPATAAASPKPAAKPAAPRPAADAAPEPKQAAKPKQAG
jgi:D-alanyl-D-alanine carboxypeptidase